MAFTDLNLDDLDFQQIVDAARRRIVRYCPEWTEYNLSDPGITLIELFAWMTSMINYRMNQVPEKNYIRFLNMLGEEPLPPQSAHTQVTFYLSTPFPIARSQPNQSTTLIAHETEVATVRANNAPEIVFTTERLPALPIDVAEEKKNEIVLAALSLEKSDSAMLVAPPIIRYVLQQGGTDHWDWNEKSPLESRVGIPLHAFSTPRPVIGDYFCIGFSSALDMRGYVLQLNMNCEATNSSGFERSNPPWVWECWCDSGTGQRWEEIQLGQSANERDTTGGLNNPEGRLVVYMPLNAVPSKNVEGNTQGLYGFWLRCRYRSLAGQGVYQESPLIRDIKASVIGITAPAQHSQAVRNEVFGISEGEPGQAFQLPRHSPDNMLLLPGENELPITVEELQRNARGEIVQRRQWTRVDSFAFSNEFSRHFKLDLRQNEVVFGPLVRQRDGNAKQYGRVPAPGCELRISHYRYGGGALGNVPENALQVMQTTLPFVDRVTNLKAAKDGFDAEDIQEAILRLQREMWSKRAVTARDFETIIWHTPELVQDEQLGRLARVKFIPPVVKTADSNVGSQPDQKLMPMSGIADIGIVPNIEASEQWQLDLTRLMPSQRLLNVIRTHIDKHRLLTTVLDIGMPSYLVVKITAKVRSNGKLPATQLIGDIQSALNAYLAPISVFAEKELGPLRQSGLSKIVQGFLESLSGASFSEEQRNGEQRWNGWPFGGSFELNEVRRLIMSLPGVLEITAIHAEGFRFDQKVSGATSGQWPPKETDLQPLAMTESLPPYALVCSFVSGNTTHQIDIAEVV